MRPVRVYLDSQDFSRLANLGEGDSLQDTRTKLLELKKAGVAEFGFSYIHVVEVLKPVAGVYAEKDRAKGRLMLDLCGKNAFPYISDLLEGARFPNRGIWGPLSLSESKPLINLQGTVREAIREELKSSRLNRAARRKLSSRSSQRELLNSLLSQEQEQVVPGIELFTNHDMIRAIQSPGGDKWYSEKVLEALLDPEKYGDLLGRLEKGNELRSMVEKLERPLMEKLRNFIDQLSTAHTEVEAQIERMSVAAAKARAIGVEVPRAFTEKQRDLRRMLQDVPGKWSLPKEFQHVKHYVFVNAKMKRHLAESDFRDLVHLAYAYDCDSVRVDGEMFNIFKGFSAFKDKLVGDLRQLPNLIEKRAR